MGEQKDRGDNILPPCSPVLLEEKIMSKRETYTVEIAGLTRELPLFEVAFV